MNPKIPGEAGFASNNADEISLSQLLGILRARLGLIVAATLLCGGLVGAASYALTPIFRSSVLLVVVDDSGKSGGLGGLAGQLAGVASLTGASLGSSGNRSELVGTLGSRMLIEGFILDNNLLPVLFENMWDAERGDWKNDVSKKPSLWAATELFINRVRAINDDKRTGLLTLSIEWHDANVAAAWANELVRLANKTLRDQAIAKSERNLAYLNAQLEKASVVEVRQAIYRLIETEFKNVMVAQGSDEYAFKVIDPGIVAEKKIRPNRFAFGFVGMALGLLLSCFYVLKKSITGTP